MSISLEMRRIPLLIMVISLFQCKKPFNYIDSDRPKLTPKKYAQGIINVEGRFQQNLTMSPDGKVYMITITDSKIWQYEKILRIKIYDNQIEGDTPEIIKNFKFQNELFIGEPVISSNNKELFFIADYPPDIWMSRRLKNSDWGNPIKLNNLSTKEGNWYPVVSGFSNLYFTNGTLFKCKRKNESYNHKTKVEGHFNKYDVRDATISSNEDYIIYTKRDSIDIEQSDLFVCFKLKDGTWGKGINLGKEINTKHIEFAPVISPDEKFLFFSRRDKWMDAKFSYIYWVNLDLILEKTKKLNTHNFISAPE